MRRSIGGLGVSFLENTNLFNLHSKNMEKETSDPPPLKPYYPTPPPPPTLNPEDVFGYAHAELSIFLNEVKLNPIL